MTTRPLRSFGTLAAILALGAGLAGCSQLQQTIQGFRSGGAASTAPAPTPSAGGETPKAPYLYTGNSHKDGGQDINACASNARSILASNGYVDAVNDSRNNDGTAVWVSADRNDLGVSAEFQCSTNGVTVLAMSGLNNDKVFAEYDRIHDLNW